MDGSRALAFRGQGRVDGHASWLAPSLWPYQFGGVMTLFVVLGLVAVVIGVLVAVVFGLRPMRADDDWDSSGADSELADPGDLGPGDVGPGDLGAVTRRRADRRRQGTRQHGQPGSR